MKNKIIGTIVFIILFLGISTGFSYGAISASSQTVNSGENVTILVTSSEKLGGYTITVTNDGGLTFVNSTAPEYAQSNGKVISGSSGTGVTSLGSYTFKTPTVTTDTTYKVSIASSGVEGPNLETIQPSTAVATITVKAPQTNNDDNGAQKPVEPTFTEVNETVYAKNTTNIRASYSTSSESYGMLQQGESIKRIGVGSNGWSKVTYNGKTAYIYSNNLTKTAPEEPKSTDKKLKTLEIKEGVLEPEFNPDITRYSISVANNVEKATINAVANDEKAKVEIIGNDSLKSGTNMIKITVTAEDGTTRIYNVEINKANQDPIKLTKLDIPGITLTPAFNSDTYKYNVEISTDSNITDFGIQTETNQEGATVEIIGNSNFQEGENLITILVTSKDGTLKTSYQIIVNKVAPAPTTSMLSGENGKINIALIAIGILLIIAIIIIIVAIIKKKKEENKDDFIGCYKPSFDEYEEKININDSEDEIQEKPFEKTSQLDIPSLYDEDYVPELKSDTTFENTEVTRRFSTNYDEKPETQKKPKNGGTGKGKHF